MEMKERESMNKDLEMIRHFACQIIKASLDSHLVNVDHYHAKMGRLIDSMWNKREEE